MKMFATLIFLILSEIAFAKTNLCRLGIASEGGGLGQFSFALSIKKISPNNALSVETAKALVEEARPTYGGCSVGHDKAPGTLLFTIATNKRGMIEDVLVADKDRGQFVDCFIKCLKGERLKGAGKVSIEAELVKTPRP